MEGAPDIVTFSDHRAITFEVQQHGVEFLTYLTTDYKALEAELGGTSLLLHPYNSRVNTARNASVSQLGGLMPSTGTQQ